MSKKCPYEKKCGGCQYIDLRYEEQLKKKQKKKGIEGGLDLKKLWKIQCAEAFIDKSLGCELLGVEPDDIFAAIGESVKLCMDILENKTAEVVEMKGE